jgi:hypothetical protein
MITEVARILAQKGGVGYSSNISEGVILILQLILTLVILDFLPQK